jgi:hypothetical protein
MIQFNTYMIAAIAVRVKKYLDLKRIASIRKTSLFDYLSWDSIKDTYENFNWHPKMKQYTGRIFTELSNLYESRVINIDTIMAVIFDYYLRTGKPMNYSTNFSVGELKERLRFLSVLTLNNQIDELKKLHDEYSNQSKFNKFSGEKLTIFGVNDKQENKLYELVKNGTVSYLLFAYFMKISKFTIDTAKIKDLQYLKFVRIIEYIIKKNIKADRIKYEV